MMTLANPLQAIEKGRAYCQRLFLLMLLLLMHGWAPHAEAQSAPQAETQAQAALPDRIYISTPTRAVTWQRYYALRDGKIWWRPNPETSHETGSWALLEGTGLPFAQEKQPQEKQPQEKQPQEKQPQEKQPQEKQGQKETSPKSAFVPPDRITSISADDFCLLAVSSEGWLYFYDHTHTWTDRFGLPAPVVVAPDRLTMPPDAKTLVLSVRHRTVEYYEDRIGNQFNWGTTGCTTFYALADDGQQIRYGDPWFPPDFSRQVCGPRRSAFIAENISSSASTLFLISRSGEMFTQFYDYDSNGGTPFFRYQYGDGPRHTLPGSDPASEQQVRVLPVEEWRIEPPIDTGAKGRLSRNITILQNGKGNAARELRVQGLGPDGKPGYYHKSLRSDVWLFRPTGEQIASEDFIHNDPAVQKDGLIRDHTFTGRLMIGERFDRRIVKVSTPDYNHHCSPFRLEITLANGQVLPLLMHTADVWTLFPEEDPETHPHAIRKLKGTLEIPDAVRASTDPMTKAILREYFADSDRKTFAWAIIATGEMVQLYRVSYPFSGAAATFIIHLGVMAPEALAQGKYKLPLYSHAFQSSLTGAAPPGQKVEPKRSKAMLIQNIRTLDAERSALMASREELKYRWTVSRRLLFGVPAVTTQIDMLSVLTSVRFTVDSLNQLDGLEQHMPALLSSTRQAYELLYDRTREDFKQAMTLANKRICTDARALRSQERYQGSKPSWKQLLEMYPELPDWIEKECAQISIP